MPVPGPAGHHLIVNLEHLRQLRGLSCRKLSADLQKAGRPIPPLGLARIARAERRVDVDELVALAAVLGVTPDALLAPPGEPAADPLPEHAAAAAARQLAGRIGDLLEAASDPAAREFASGSVDRALRRVQIEVEELLEQVKAAPPG
jgi:transcriptional regulator with XRE-family HTH domain